MEKEQLFQLNAYCVKAEIQNVKDFLEVNEKEGTYLHIGDTVKAVLR